MTSNRADVGKAVKHYREFLEWRQKDRVDEVLQEAPYPPAVEAALVSGYNPVLIEGLDVRARPVMLIDLSHLDVPALRRQGVSLAMLVRRHVRAMEELVRAIDRAPNPYAGHLLLLDIGGCTAGKFLHAYSFWRELARLGQRCYPECLGGLAMLRGGGAAAWAVGKVKAFLDPETSAKIQLHDTEHTAHALVSNLPLSTRLPAGSPLAALHPAATAAGGVGGLSSSLSSSSSSSSLSTLAGAVPLGAGGAAAVAAAAPPPPRKGHHRRVPSVPADRRQRAMARLPELRASLEALSPPLTAGQWVFCSEATLLRYLAYNEIKGDLAADLPEHGAGSPDPPGSLPGSPPGTWGPAGPPTPGSPGTPGGGRGSTTVRKTLAAMQATLKWRDTQGFDPDPATAPPRRCEECEADPHAHCFFSIGLDKRGWEVLYCCPPRSRLKDPRSSSTHAFKCFEAINARAPDGPGTGKFVMAVDLHGLGFSDLNPQTALTTTSAILAHYVGQIGQVIILDAPLAFKGVWAMLSGMLDAPNAARVQMLRGEAMGRYFSEHLSDAQAGFMTEVLKMKATPGSLPPSAPALRMPLATPRARHAPQAEGEDLAALDE
jgi:hypothetical protein